MVMPSEDNTEHSIWTYTLSSPLWLCHQRIILNILSGRIHLPCHYGYAIRGWYWTFHLDVYTFLTIMVMPSEDNTEHSIWTYISFPCHYGYAIRGWYWTFHLDVYTFLTIMVMPSEDNTEHSIWTYTLSLPLWLCHQRIILNILSGRIHFPRHYGYAIRG